MKLRWSGDALRDLADIHDHVSADAPGQADKLVEELIECAERLEIFPKSGRSVPEYHDPAIREVIKGPYRIIYRIKPTDIDVVTVFHGTKRLPLELPEFE